MKTKQLKIKEQMFQMWSNLIMPVRRSQYTIYRKDGKWSWKNQVGWIVLKAISPISRMLYPYKDTTSLYL